MNATMSLATALPAANRALPMPRFELGERLTAEQREFLDEFGFIRFRSFVPRAEVAALAAEVEEIDRRLVAEGRTDIFGVPLIFGTRAGGTRFVQRMCFASVLGPRLHAFLQDPRFAAILEVAGPGYRIGERERDGLVVNHYRSEPGSSFSRLGWHTDSLRDVFYLEKPRRYLNVGIYLDDSPIEKGGVRVIPFSHKQGIWPMLTRKAHFMDTDPDPAEYAIVADAGDLTIHDGRIWHRVERASVTGEASQRRVMYVPLMEGPLKPKDERSPTPLYFRLRRLARY
jgi:ectoine hydroxylase-related dioxygenase (phytanoyl-CoA dioxygenase family)